MKKQTGVKLPRGFEMKEAEKLWGCPALPLCVEAWKYLLDKGFTEDGAIPIAWDHSALWIEFKGEPVAAMTYTYHEWKAELWINQSYVQSRVRRIGLYRALYARVKAIAIEKGCRKIASGTSQNNDAMQRAATVLGRRAEFVIYGERLR